MAKEHSSVTAFGRERRTAIVLTAATLVGAMSACSAKASQPAVTSPMVTPDKPVIGPVVPGNDQDQNVPEFDITGRIRVGNVDVVTKEQRGFDPKSEALTPAGVRDTVEDLARIGKTGFTVDLEIGVPTPDQQIFVFPAEADVTLRESIVNGTSSHAIGIVEDQSNTGRRVPGYTGINPQTGDATSVVGELPADFPHQFSAPQDVNENVLTTEVCNNILDVATTINIKGMEDTQLSPSVREGLYKIGHEAVCNTLGLADGIKAAGGDYGTYEDDAQNFLNPKITHETLVPYPVLPKQVFDQL